MDFKWIPLYFKPIILETSRAQQWAPQALRSSKGLRGPRWNALTQPNSLMSELWLTDLAPVVLFSSAPVPRLRLSTETELWIWYRIRSFGNLNQANRYPRSAMCAMQNSWQTLLAILFISIPISRKISMGVQTWGKAHCSISIGLLRGRVCASIDRVWLVRERKAPVVRWMINQSMINEHYYQWGIQLNSRE